MRYNAPPPDPATRITPSFVRRVAFALGGLAAVALRLFTAPWRARLARRRGADAPVFLYEPYGMGDVIALQPLVRAHLDAGRAVVLAAKPAWADLVPPHPAFSFVPVSPGYTSYDPRRKYRGFFRQARRLARALRPHAAGADGIDVRGDVRSLVILYLAGCGRVRTLPRYFTANDCRVVPLAARFVPLRRDVSRRLVNAAFAPEGATLDRPTMKHLMPSGGVVPDPRRIGLVPLTPWAGKQWVPERWRDVVQKLKAAGFTPVVLCGPGERAAALDATACEPGDVDCREADSPRRWVALLAKCGAIVTVNTGPMHVADALDKPLVVIEGGSRLPLWAPENDHAVVIHHQPEAPCAPCHQVGDPGCGRRCLMLVEVDEVLDALRELIAP
ncbi:MAG: glycosyltransferase family 9 protein [Kiritimatiellia bacterium]